MEILPIEDGCSNFDKQGNSPLYAALKNGRSQVAEKMLMSSCSYSLSSKNTVPALHFAPLCSGNVLKLLLVKHSELMDMVDNDSRFNVLHKWAHVNKVWPFNILLKEGSLTMRTKAFSNSIQGVIVKKIGDSPLYIAARNENIDIMRVLVDGYKQEIGIGELLDNPREKIKNKDEDMSLHVVLNNKNNEKSGVVYLITRSNVISDSWQQGSFVEEILRTYDVRHKMLRRYNGVIVLHHLKSVPETLSRKLLEKFWWRINLLNDNRKIALDETKKSKRPMAYEIGKEPVIQKESIF